MNIFACKNVICPVSFTLIRAGVAVQGPLVYVYLFYFHLHLEWNFQLRGAFYLSFFLCTVISGFSAGSALVTLYNPKIHSKALMR